MPVNLPSLSDQIAAALSAPIPFFFALVLVAIVIWRVFEWRDKAVIEKTKSLYELSQSAAQLAAQIAADKEAKLSTTIDALNQQIKEFTTKLEKQPKQVPADVIPALRQLNQTSTLANDQLGELRKANSNVADTLRAMGQRVPSVGPLTKIWEEIKRNDPSTQIINPLRKDPPHNSQSDG